MTQAVLDFELDRVKSRLARPIVEWCKFCLRRRDGRFQSEELYHYIDCKVRPRPAPGSADRILRELRRQGLIDYRVVNRRASLYEVLEVRA